MNEGLIPRRYAKALFEYATEKLVATQIYGLMQNLEFNFAQAQSLQTIVSNPFASSADKVKLLTTAAGATAEDVVYADFLTLLSTNKRIDMVRSIAMAYQEIYRKANNIYQVEVVTASELSSQDESRMKSLIRTHLNGGEMEYSHRIDPTLIGGFIVNIGSERLDASISNELKQLRLKLLSN